MITRGRKVARAVTTLSFAVRVPVVIHHLSRLMAATGILALVPAAVCAATGEYMALGGYVLAIGCFALLAVAGWRRPSSRRLQLNEALVICTLVFSITAVIMTLPLLASGFAFDDALLDSVSAVTTTGLSTLGSVEGRPFSFLFGRAWLQWVGGLGVLVLALAVLVSPGQSAKRLGYSQLEPDDLAGGTRGHARRVLQVYVLLTVAFIGLALLAGAPARNAVPDIMAAISTGGFSSHDASLAGWQGVAPRIIVMAAAFAGAISLGWYFHLAMRRAGSPTGNLELLVLIGLWLGITWLLVLIEAGAWQRSWNDWPELLELALSAQTTAGFSGIAPSELQDASQMVLSGGMLVGGSTGSTAGGIKALRLLFALQLLLLALVRASVPSSARVPLRIAGERVNQTDLESVLALIVVYVGVVFVASMIFVAHGYEATPALFEVASAISTTGLSAGITSSELPLALKLLLCALMLMGRVEVLAVLICLMPHTWFGKRRAIK